MSWHGKQCVVTGAANGIGRCLTWQLLEQGSVVWALDIDATALERLQQEASKFGFRVNTRPIDVCADEALKGVKEEIRSSGRGLHCWVNNAGIAGLGGFEEISQDNFDRVIDINFRATAVGTRLALELMEPQGQGTIVNMASVAGFVPVGYMSAYCASKSAVVAFTKSVRAELQLKHSNIHLMIVSPGFVDTQMVGRATPEGLPEWLEWTLVKPEKVAKMILSGVVSQKTDLFPTWNGKMILAAHRMLPNLSGSSTKLLLSKRLKDLLFSRLTPPR